MNDVYIVLISIISIVVVLIVLFQIRKYYARKKVREKSNYEKLRDTNRAVGPYGFLFEPVQEIFYSKLDAWQREYGYCKLYDEMAPTFNMVMDCEPVTFDYDNRHWMIEFWKGQYGILTGGEIGVYVTKHAEIDIPELFTGQLYQAVSDDERLNMSFRLKKNGRQVLVRSGYHWWLTGFKIGEFSRPSQLIMEWEILFPNAAMRNAFIEGMYNIGYRLYELQVDALFVRGTFNVPKTKQPRRRLKPLVWFAQQVNKQNCRFFLNKTREFDKTLDKLEYIRYCYPLLYRLVIRIGNFRKIPKIFKKINRRRR